MEPPIGFGSGFFCVSTKSVEHGEGRKKLDVRFEHNHRYDGFKDLDWSFMLRPGVTGSGFHALVVCVGGPALEPRGS